MALKRPRIILIGSSTGGIEAITFALKDLAPRCPPIVISQHILPNFCQSFTEQLQRTSGRSTKIITNSVDLVDGEIYIQHPETSLVFKDNKQKISVYSQPTIAANIFRPCIDDFLNSFCKSIKGSPSSFGLGIILTGMGSDGANGLLNMKNCGHITISQDQASSTVYGMPKAAKALGASMHEMSLTTIRDNIRFLS